jgi:hypothetical protein
MRALQFWIASFFILAGLVTACLGTEDGVLEIHASGTVEGLVYFDANGDRELGGADSPLAGVGVRLLVRGTRDTLARATSDANGLFRMREVPAANYEVVVNPGTIGDTVIVASIDPAEIAVTRQDTVATFIAVSFPLISVEEAKQLPPGEKVFVEGIALNHRERFGDQTVHLAGDSLAIRATRVLPAIIFAGDSVRFLGTTHRDLGQSTLDNVNSFFLGIADPPPAPEVVTTALAAGADEARRDAALVKVLDALISDTATVDADFVVTVDDGSGPLEVIFDGDVVFTLDAILPDSVIDVTGLLVPSDELTWALKPRFDDDVEVKEPKAPTEAGGNRLSGRHNVRSGLPGRGVRATLPPR